MNLESRKKLISRLIYSNIHQLASLQLKRMPNTNCCVMLAIFFSVFDAKHKIPTLSSFLSSTLLSEPSALASFSQPPRKKVIVDGDDFKYFRADHFYQIIEDSLVKGESCLDFNLGRTHQYLGETRISAHLGN